MKKEEDLLSSFDSILQQEIFQNSDITVDDSIVEQKSSSLEIDQNDPFYGENIEVLDQHQLIHSEDMPIYDEYSNEKEQIPTSPFVDLRSSQCMYDNYESNFDEEQHCVEINHPKSVEGIEQPYLQLNLQVAESGSHYEEEDIQRYFDLQQEEFPYNFIDPFLIIWSL